LYWAFSSNPTVHILKAKSTNIRLAVAVPAPKLNSSTVRHCVQPKRAKKPDQGTIAWLLPCLHKSYIEFQMSMAEISIINCCLLLCPIQRRELGEGWVIEFRPPGTAAE